MSTTSSKRAALGDISNGGTCSTASSADRLGVDVRVTRQAAARQRLLESQSKQPPQHHPAMIEEAPTPNECVAMSVDADIDTYNDPNPQRCSHYVKDIYAYLREREMDYRASPHYMQTQRDINATMRAILIDWLVEVRHLPYLPLGPSERCMRHTHARRRPPRHASPSCPLTLLWPLPAPVPGC